MQLSPLDVARLEEARQARSVAEIALDAEPLAGGFLCWSGPGSWSNQACGIGFDGRVGERELERLIEFYRERDAEPRVELCPLAHESFAAGLAARGFVVRAFENVLARELAAGENFSALHPHGWPDGLALARADPEDERAVAAWVDVSTSGFEPPVELFEVPRRSYMLADDPALVLAEVAARMLELDACDAYLASLDGAPAGGGALESRPPVAALFGASVLPPFRRRGIHAALILARLARARERGCRLAVIHSKPGLATERNAARVGFALAYTKTVLGLPLRGPPPRADDANERAERAAGTGA